MVDEWQAAVGAPTRHTATEADVAAVLAAMASPQASEAPTENVFALLAGRSAPDLDGRYVGWGL